MEIIGIIVGIIIAMIPYLWKRYFSRPELTIEIIYEGGLSTNEGLSHKNDTSKGYVEANTAIHIFKITWKCKLIIRNNSDNIAYYPKIILDSTNPKFTSIDNLNELKPIPPSESVELKTEYVKYEESQAKNRTELNTFPDELKNMRILLEYKNSSKIKCFTIYNQADKTKNLFMYRMPKDFKK